MKNRILILISAVVLLNIPTFGQNKEVHFNSSYRTLNNNKVTIEINEMQELVYIIFSLTETGRKNGNMINQKTAYYEDVQDYFGAYADMPVVKKFDELLKENLINYFILAANAYGFRLENNKILPTGVYDFPAKGIGKYEVKVNPIPALSKDLEVFVEKTGFRGFYEKHQDYYNGLIREYETFAAVDEQKQWLEQKFDYTINSYRVLTSSLIGGMNATHTFEDQNFREILLFLPTIKTDEEWDAAYRKAVNQRIIFTEIDHNYVGPVSERYKEMINKVFHDRTKWVNTENKSTDYYPNPVKVFDEYFTWGLYLVYAGDLYANDAGTFDRIVENVNGMMLKKGFPKAKEYNEELLKLYKKYGNENIEKLYEPLLKWGATQ